MYESTLVIAEWIANYVKSQRPSYEIQCIPASGYTKVSIMSGYFDYCISRVGNHKDGRYFTINATPEFNKDDQLFRTARDTNKNHWDIPIKGIEDVMPYKKYFLISADYLYKTYEIESNPPADDGLFYSDGIGIGVNIKL